MPRRRSSSTQPSTPAQARRRRLATAASMIPLAIGLATSGVTGGGQGSTPAQSTTQQTEQVEPGFAQSCGNPHFPTGTPTVMDNSSCSIAGNGGAETFQNEAKNNFCAGTLDPPQAITISDLQDLQTQVQNQHLPFGNSSTHPLTNQPGPIKERTPLVKLGEGRQVVLLGFVKIARQEGAESVNCGKMFPDKNDTAHHDIHISIVQNATDEECSGVVVEMIPHHRPPEWNQPHVQEVADAHLLVRVTGQQMFDSSHSPCINGVPVPSGAAHDPARISLWEIHPIYKFEVCPQGDCSSGGWVPLELWKKG